MSDKQKNLKKDKVEENNQVVNQVNDEDLSCLTDRLKDLGLAAIYATQIQFGGPDAPWHDDADLILAIKNRNAVVPTCVFPEAGTTVTWSSSNGNGSITFFADGEFRGSAQFPGEGPVGYRGQLK